MGSSQGFTTGVIHPKSLFHELSYVWQLYLPRLPGMTHYFKGMTTWKDVWFDRSVGFYGWMDTTFPGWVNNIALVPAGAIALLCGRELLTRRTALRARLAELGAYAAICLGVLLMLGVTSYVADALEHRNAFGETRYLLPLIPLLGAVIALAVRGAGRRWAPVVGAAMVVLFLGHDVFSQLQVIARYYRIATTVAEDLCCSSARGLPTLTDQSPSGTQRFRPALSRPCIGCPAADEYERKDRTTLWHVADRAPDPSRGFRGRALRSCCVSCSPRLSGMIDGTVSSLAPIFAAAIASNSHTAFWSASRPRSAPG